MGRMGTSLFNWTNESPLFFRGLSVSRWHTSSRRAIEGRLWRGRCGSALFTNTTWPCEVSQRWEPEVWHPQALPVLPFSSTVFLLLGLRKTRRGVRLSTGHLCLQKPSERKLCYERPVFATLVDVERTVKDSSSPNRHLGTPD